MHRLGFCLLFAACASGGQSTTSDAAPPGDTGGCTLGTPDHCGTCDHVCPGVDNAGTERTCSAATDLGTCNITCKGEYYDLDGMVANGCEAQDLPVQDQDLTAVLLMLPDSNTGTGSTACDGATNPCTHTAQIYSDQRTHDGAPTTRPLGRPDWYKLVAAGTGGPNQVGACLGITNFPQDDTYEVCIGNAGDTNPSACKTTVGLGQSACVAPPTAADAGTFYIRVRKLGGSNTANQYALFVQH